MGFGAATGDTLQAVIQNDPQFSFTVAPGKYTFVAMSFHSERLRIPLVVESNKSNIVVNATLPALGFEGGDFDKVYIKGGFNNWTVEEESQLTKEGDIWVFKDSSRVPYNDHYDFYINGTTLHDLGNPNTSFVQHYARFNTLYKGGGIRFDPSLYKTPTTWRWLNFFRVKSFVIILETICWTLKKRP